MLSAVGQKHRSFKGGATLPRSSRSLSSKSPGYPGDDSLDIARRREPQALWQTGRGAARRGVGFHIPVMAERVASDSCGGVVTRFAPSPTFFLHLGHVYAASVAWHAARRARGRFLVRLEDIDPQRCRTEFAAAILEDLAWLGFSADAPVRLQSQHMDDYQAALTELAARGLVYPCFCSRADIAREIAASGAAPHAAEAAYPGTCRRLAPAARQARIAAGDPHAWRFDLGAALASAPPLRFFEVGDGWIQATPAAYFGDVVLGRRDVPASYHLCVTHDDALQGVTLVTRAADLKPATHLHVLLQHLLGWPTPAYRHHRLLQTAGGERLSKRNGAPPVRDLRAQGLTPRQVIRRAHIKP
jgi:glutamyl-Q tRNA(Asp) synthetase